MIFQADFGASESKTFTVSGGGKVEYKPEDFKAHGRFVRERFDDLNWMLNPQTAQKLGLDPADRTTI